MNINNIEENTKKIVEESKKIGYQTAMINVLKVIYSKKDKKIDMNDIHHLIY